MQSGVPDITVYYGDDVADIILSYDSLIYLVLPLKEMYLRSKGKQANRKNAFLN